MLQPWYEYNTFHNTSQLFFVGSLLKHLKFFYCIVDVHLFISVSQKIIILDNPIFRVQFCQLFTWYSHFLSNIIFKVSQLWSSYQDRACCMYVCTNFIRWCALALLIQIFFRHKFCNISVPKVQFLAIEIARNREGYNDGLRETYCKKKQPAS